MTDPEAAETPEGHLPAPAPSGGVPPWAWLSIFVGICGVGGCILLIAAYLIPSAVAPGRRGSGRNVIEALRWISSVQAQFREGDFEGDGTLDYATSLEELSNAGLIDEVLGSGTMRGYVFSLSGGTYDWQCSATPMNSSKGRRNFIICSDGVVRFSSHGPADCTSPALE